MALLAPAEFGARSAAGKHERLAYSRASEMHALAESPEGHPKGYWFDDEAADWSVEFVESRCRHHKGEWAGKPLTLEEWQRFILREVFGWKRPDGTRLYRIAYVEIPRKNGKSEMAGAIALLLLVADDEAGAEVYASATKEDQAKIVWDVAKQMVKQDATLKELITIRQKALVCEETVSTFKPLGSDSETLDGLNPHGNVVDELHAHKKRGLWDVLDTAMGARRQPLTWAITTAGVYDPESIGWEQHELALKVLEGVIEDDARFAFVACADEGDDQTEGDDPFAPETLEKANPNYGVSVKPEYLNAQAEKAQQSPSFLNTYLRLHLNRWTQQVTRWISPEAWSACGDPVDEERLRGRLCYGGLDLSTKLDISACVLAFPPDAQEDPWDFLFRFWCPEDTIVKRSKQDRVPYDAWVRDGFMKATAGNVIDYDFIEHELVSLRERFDLRELAFDPWNATQVATHLSDKGLTMVEMRQGFASLSEPSKEFEKLVVSKRVRHGGHPVMRWMVSNVSVKSDPAGNIKPDKSSAIGRIDGVVAAIMAIGRGTVAPAPPQYDVMFLGGR